MLEKEKIIDYIESRIDDVKSFMDNTLNECAICDNIYAIRDIVVAFGDLNMLEGREVVKYLNAYHDLLDKYWELKDNNVFVSKTKQCL